ncbi:rRNA-processing protein and EBNA1-binding protein ebp2, partial [Dissophora globulifera]
PALKRLREQIALPTNIPWSETQSVTSTQAVSVADPDDDLNREVAFYNQALEAAVLGRERIRKEGGVFERPGDYFAEMIKSDEHMAKIRQRLLDENACSFRQGNDNTANADDEFDVALASDDEQRRSGGAKNGNNKRSASSTPGSRSKRLKKDQKFGFGGKKRNAKSNTAESSADMSGFNVKRNKSTSFKSGGHKAARTATGGAKKRPGKARRQNAGGRK